MSDLTRNHVEAELCFDLKSREHVVNSKMLTMMMINKETDDRGSFEFASIKINPTHPTYIYFSNNI